MDLSKLATLKTMLITAGKFSEVYRYFLDHFGEDPAFLAKCESARDPLLEAALAEISRQMYGPAGVPADVVLTRFGRGGFIHGAFSVAGRVGAVIYFEDLRKGLVAVAAGGDEMKYARFTAKPPAAGGLTSWLPSDN